MAYPFHIATQLQYYVQREKCKVNDVIFPSGCEARAINLGNKNMKIGIFTGGTSVRSKNIFTDISRYPTGKHEMNFDLSPKKKVSSFYYVITIITSKSQITPLFKWKPSVTGDISIVQLLENIHISLNDLLRCPPASHLRALAFYW